MKTFREFMIECHSIQETSLTRVMRKSQKGGMAIMSAQRGDKSKKENKARSKQLERDVRGAGLPGPTKVAGRYTENPGTPQEKRWEKNLTLLLLVKWARESLRKLLKNLVKSMTKILCYSNVKREEKQHLKELLKPLGQVKERMLKLVV